MASGRHVHDYQLGALLSAMIERACLDANRRPVAEDLEEILATAGERTDLLADVLRYRAADRADVRGDRARELVAGFVARGVPGMEAWLPRARDLDTDDSA